MNKMTQAAATQAIREITRELTGRRERDILYLRTQIEQFDGTPGIAETLRRILRCLAGADTPQAAA